MEGEHHGSCAVCGEEVKSAPSNQKDEKTSLLESYLRSISCHIQEEIFFGGFNELVACDRCSAKINSFQQGKERFEELRKEVSEVEMNLHRKLTDMESVGQKVLRNSNEIDKLIKEQIQKKSLGQEVEILRKGTEKASVVMKETMRELKGKRSCVESWSCGIDAGNANGVGTSSSSSEGIIGVISSVTSLAARNNDFEAGEVFQVKTEQEQSDEEEDDNASTGVPVPECVVKLEDEEVRSIRHRVIYGNRKVRKVPFEALQNTMLHIPSNQEGQAAEFEVIELENEEVAASNELSGLPEESTVGIEGCEEGIMTTANSKKRAFMEVDRDQGEVQETREKICRQNASPGSHRKGAVVEESPNGSGTEHSDHAATPLIPMQVGGASQDEAAPKKSSMAVTTEEQMYANADEEDKHGNVENDTMSEKGDASKEKDENNTQSSNKSDEMNNLRLDDDVVKERVTGKTAKPDTVKEENEKWFSGIMAICNSKEINVKSLRQRLKIIPKISSELFHKLVIKLKEVGKTEAFNSYSEQNVSGTYRKLPIYRIIKNVEVKQHTLETLDILFQAGVDFKIVNRAEQNVLFAAIEGNRSVFFINNLITRGVNENQINAKGQNLLFFAAKKGCSLEVFEFLVNKGVYLDGWDKIWNPYQTIFWDIWDSSGGAYQKRLCLLKALVNTRDDRRGKCALKHFLSVGDTTRTIEEFHDLVQFIYSSKERFGWFEHEYDEYGTTLLHQALSKYEIGEEAFEMLIKAQCNFKKVDKYGRGSLHFAMFGGSCPWILEKLIEQGEDVNANVKGNESLLHCAAYFDCKMSLETLQFLIEKGLDITALDSDGFTVLELACSYKRVTANVITSIFIWSFDAGVRHLNSAGTSIVHYTAEYGTPAALDYILGKSVNVDFNEIDEDGLTLFETTVSSVNENSVENAKVLVKYGADPQFRKGQRKTILHHLSVLSDITAALRFCLEELRLDVNATDENGMTPLLAIIHENFFPNDYIDEESVESKLEKLKMLLENGADVNAKPNQDFYVNSSHHHYMEVIKFQTPLHLALHLYFFNPTSKSSALELIKLLLNYGANVNEPTLEGWTAVHIVIGWKKLDRQTLVLLTDLFKDRVDSSAKTRKGQSALHLAAENKNIDSIRFCLEKGLDVNVVDEEGKTPLDYLLPRFGQKKMGVKVLLDAMQLLLENGVTSETKQKVKDKMIEGLWNTDGLNISKTTYLELLALFN